MGGLNLKICQDFVGTKCFLKFVGDRPLWGELNLYGGVIFIITLSFFYFFKFCELIWLCFANFTFLCLIKLQARAQKSNLEIDCKQTLLLHKLHTELVLWEWKRNKHESTLTEKTI